MSNTPDPVESLLQNVRDATAIDCNMGGEDWRTSDLAIEKAKAAIEAHYAKLYGGMTDHNTDIRKAIVTIFSELEDNLNDPTSLLGYGHAIEDMTNFLTTAIADAPESQHRGNDMTNTDSSQDNGHLESPSKGLQKLRKELDKLDTPPKSTDNTLDKILEELNPDNPFDIGQDNRKAKAKQQIQATLQNKIAEARIEEIYAIDNKFGANGGELYDYLVSRLAQLQGGDKHE